MSMCVVKGGTADHGRLVCVYVCGEEGGTADHGEAGMCLCVWYADIVQRLKGMADQNITKLYPSIIVVCKLSPKCRKQKNISYVYVQ